MIERKVGVKCPNCGKRGVMDRITTMRRNFFFGKKSTAVYSPKIIKYRCNGLYKGRLCGFRERFGEFEYDYIGDA